MNVATTKTMTWLLTASVVCLMFDFQTSMAASPSFVAGLRQHQQLSAIRSSKFDKYGSRIPPKEFLAATADDGESDAESIGDRLLAGYAAAGSRREDDRWPSASQRRRDGRRQRQNPLRWTGDSDDERTVASVLRSLTRRGRPRTGLNNDLVGRRLNQRMFSEGVSLDQPEARRQLRSSWSSKYASDMDEIARTLSQSQSDLYAPEEEEDDDEDDDQSREDDDEEEEENNNPPRYLKGQPQQGRYFNPLTRSPHNRLPGWFQIPPQKGKRPITNEGSSFNPLTRMTYRRPQQ